MPRIVWPGGWPLAWKVPLLVASLMVGIATMISQVVLSRLASDQENNLRQLTDAYLDGLSAAVLQPVIRADVWETFDALDQARNHYGGVEARYTLVVLPDGNVLAASDPIRFPMRSRVSAVVGRRFPQADGLVIDDVAGRAWLARTLRTEGYSVGRILAEIDITELLRVRREVLLTLVVANAGLTIAFAAIGYFALKRMLRPLSVLTRYVERVRDGQVEPISATDRHTIANEFLQLFDRFDAMGRALSERASLASRLAAQEKYAVLGKLASGMAHEVNNPLGGLFNALDTLRRHGADACIRDSTLNLLQRGLIHIRNVVHSTLVIYRREASNQFARAADIDDLRLLIEPEVARKAIALDWRNALSNPVPVAVGSLRQATLNLLINACAAVPQRGVVTLRASAEGDALVIEVGDGGLGLPEAIAKNLVEGSDAIAPTGDGLGLWIVARLVADERGTIRAGRENGRTLIRVTWPFRQDVGLSGTIASPSSEDMAHVE